MYACFIARAQDEIMYQGEGILRFYSGKSLLAKVLMPNSPPRTSSATAFLPSPATAYTRPTYQTNLRGVPKPHRI
ncbi:hypothetical protein BC938DRAFT_472906 [Jimgerdemannia flammicorona]|uniref:Uncharacterized protein n=1 Tax=Jimgerdemannia flammicorona TaxID=994334 RepID=A0A433QTM7_9FUNG|nr:hypothetical protein BC938DRAFT_472906 [Jimgerdemannia flammicorona]